MFNTSFAQVVTLKFHSNLQKYTNGVSEHTLEVYDLVDIRNSLEHLFPKLRKHIRRIRAGSNSRENIALVSNHRRVDYTLNYLKKDDTEFYVVPLFIGGGSNFGKILLGAALIGAVILTGGAAAPGLGAVASAGGMGFAAGGAAAAGAAGLTLGGIAMSIGVSMVLSGVMGMLMKPSVPGVQGQQTSDSEARKENKIFSGLANSTSSHIPVPLVYGRTRVGGQFVSGEIRTFQHGKNETVIVGDSFPSGAS